VVVQPAPTGSASCPPRDGRSRRHEVRRPPGISDPSSGVIRNDFSSRRRAKVPWVLDEELLVRRRGEPRSQIRAGLPLAAGLASRAELAHLDAPLAPPTAGSSPRQTPRRADPRGVDLQRAAEVEGLERHESLREIPGASHDNRVLHMTCCTPSEHPGNLLAQTSLPGNPYSACELGADRRGVGNQEVSGSFRTRLNAIKRWRVSVDHGLMWSARVRQRWKGRSTEGLCFPITFRRLDLDDVLRSESALSTARGVIQMSPLSSRMDRFPTRRGGHAIGVRCAP